MSTEKIVIEEGAQLDFSTDMSYADYLHLDAVLGICAAICSGG